MVRGRLVGLGAMMAQLLVTQAQFPPIGKIGPLVISKTQVKRKPIADSLLGIYAWDRIRCNHIYRVQSFHVIALLGLLALQSFHFFARLG